MPFNELTEIETAIIGLTYPSETDAPFDLFRWPAGPDPRNQILAHAGNKHPIEEIPVDVFFSELDESEDAARYRQLRQVLGSHLTGLKVFRVGSIRIDVYLIGQTPSGSWAGLHTISVET